MTARRVSELIRFLFTWTTLLLMVATLIAIVQTMPPAPAHLIAAGR